MAEDQVRKMTVPVPESQIALYRDARDPTTGAKQYKFLEDIDGFVKLHDGTIKPDKIPADQIDVTALSTSPFILPAKGLKEVAKQNSRYRKMRKIAEDEPASNVLARSVASAMTGGLTTHLADEAHGKEYEQVRAMSESDKYLTYYTGKAVGAIALGLMPIPGLGKLASAAGPLKGARNVSSIFEIAAGLSSKAAGGIAGKTFVSGVAKRTIAATTYGAVAEVPLSLAFASADIVDNNRDYTVEALMSEFGTQYLFGVGLGFATAVPIHLLRGAGSLVKKGGGKLVAHGIARYVGREGLRGRGYGGGDILESAIHKFISGQADDVAKASARSWAGRLVASAPGDDFLRIQKQVWDHATVLQTSTNATALKNSAKELMLGVEPTDDLFRQLSLVRDTAEHIVEARKAAKPLIQNGIAFAETAQEAVFRHPPGLKHPTSLDFQELKGLLNVAGAGPVTFKSKNYVKVLDETLNIRRGLPAGPGRNALDRFLETNWENITPYLAQMDGFDNAARRLVRDFGKYGMKGTGVDEAYDLIGVPGGFQGDSFRAKLQALGGSYRGLQNANIVDSKQFRPFIEGGELTFETRLNDLEGALDAMGQANLAGNRIMQEPPIVLRPPVPTTHLERLTAEVNTVIGAKLRIQEALGYAAFHGGGLRHTTAFGGVFLFRNMTHAMDKKAAFVTYHDVLTRAASSPEALMSSVSEVVGGYSQNDLDGGARMAGTAVAAVSYLNNQLPRSPDPLIQPQDFSTAEIENFLESLGAILDPFSVIATARDGSVTDTAVDAFRSVYPELYYDAVIDVGEFMDEFREDLDHATMLGFDAFTGYSLGIADGPAPQFTMQAPYAQTTQQAASIGGPENRRMTYQQGTTPAQKISAF